MFEHFEVGEIAILQNISDIGLSHLNGEECIIIEPLEFRPVQSYGTLTEVPAYQIEVPATCQIFNAEPINLKKKPQDDDSNPNTKITWDKCYWSPITQREKI